MFARQRHLKHKEHKTDRDRKQEMWRDADTIHVESIELTLQNEQKAAHCCSGRLVIIKFLLHSGTCIRKRGVESFRMGGIARRRVFVANTLHTCTCT